MKIKISRRYSFVSVIVLLAFHSQGKRPLKRGKEFEEKHLKNEGCS